MVPNKMPKSASSMGKNIISRFQTFLFFYGLLPSPSRVAEVAATTGEIGRRCLCVLMIAIVKENGVSLAGLVTHWCWILCGKKTICM